VQLNIRINPKSSPQVFTVGEERTPVIILDDFALDTGDVIRYAVQSASFAPDEAYVYPGVRAKPPKEYIQEIVRALGPLLGQVYSIPAGLALAVNAYYSLVATPPEKLQVLQRVPHFDSTMRYFYAVTHYLNPGNFGGTGLFRHTPTGFENVTEDRLQTYAQAGDSYLRAHGDPPAEYIRATGDHYELIEAIDYKPNRLIAYPGSLLHSGLIDPDKDINADPATGRLTANFFMRFK
jgi:hypothetical protein